MYGSCGGRRMNAACGRRGMAAMIRDESIDAGRGGGGP